jgi:hypothetical protein
MLRDTPSTQLAYLMLVKGTSPWAHVIQKVTQSPYSHVCFAIGGMTFEMDFGGWYSRPVANYAWAYDAYGMKGMTQERTETIRRWWKARRWARYNYGHVLAQGATIIYHHLTQSKDLLHPEASYSCAQAVCDSAEEAGLIFQKGEGAITPADISKDPLVYAFG